MSLKTTKNSNNKIVKSILLFSFSILLCFPAFCKSIEKVKKSIPVVIYYDYPPFLIEKSNRGLGTELTEYLNSKSKGKFSFYSMFLPRGRLEKLLEDPNWFGLVAWINPVFVNDKSQTKYIWSHAIMHEVDYVASIVDHPIEYNGIESLYGHTMGTVLNQRYADVEDAIKSGKIKHENVVKQDSIVTMLLKKRIDFAFLSKSTIKWFRKEFPDFDRKLHLAKKPRNEFDRHVLITPNIEQDCRDFILKTVNEMKHDEDWQTRFNKY